MSRPALPSLSCAGRPARLLLPSSPSPLPRRALLAALLIAVPSLHAARAVPAPPPNPSPSPAPATTPAVAPASAHTVWVEAESLGPLRGGNFSYQKPENAPKGTWSVAGPGVAAEWTQGGESEWMSIAARADEPGEVVAGRDVEVPAAGTYTLWARYADYRGRKESFGVRVRQGGAVFSHVFGEKPVVDELDPMKLLWDWSFGWDRAQVGLAKGPARVEVYTTGPTEARRQVDCLCLTTDASYHPAGREKPDCPTWALLREMRQGGMADVEPLLPPAGSATRPVPGAWKIADGPPAFLWNAGQPWLDDLKPPADAKGAKGVKGAKETKGAKPAKGVKGPPMEWPYTIDASLRDAFLEAFAGKDVPVYGDPLSGPALHVPHYPSAFGPPSPFTDWLDRHGERKFGILLNYADPNWPKGADEAGRAAVHQRLRHYGDRFLGFIAGESFSYGQPDAAALDAKIKSARTRHDVLEALREAHTAATIKKFTAYYGAPVSAEQAWGDVIPCLSAGNEAYAHALAAWGVRRVGHENTGNSPTLARRLAFLRGAARQFGVHVADYQSCNLGDASTIFSRESYFFPASSRYILDNQYDAWAGSGVNWVLKDYLLFYLAGADTFYHEEGGDLFWKPGGNSAGDDFPVQLSPRGRVTEAVVRLARAHPRGVQYTPVAFLLDEAHGYSQEQFTPGAFGLDPQLNPAVLALGRHQDAIRAWFDVAYFPAPETQNEPASAIRQTYVNGLFGDVFDAVVTAPRRAGILGTYPVVIAAGDVPVSEEWGQALRDYVEAGGTLVACAEQFSGPGVARLGLPALGPEGEAAAIQWTMTGRVVPSGVFRYRPPAAEGARVLASTPEGKPLAVLLRRGKGQLIVVGVPMGLGIDRRPVPLLALLLRHLTQGLIPVSVSGDVEWAANRLDDGGWLVALLNNRGVIKPQHGVLPTDHREAQMVTLRAAFKVARGTEWMTGADVPWQGSEPEAAAGAGTARSTARVTVPAGAVRLVEIHPAP